MMISRFVVVKDIEQVNIVIHLYVIKDYAMILLEINADVIL